jgi:hypothetical protein
VLPNLIAGAFYQEKQKGKTFVKNRRELLRCKVYNRSENKG